MKKKDRISAFVEQLGPGSEHPLDARYTGFFTCFNGGQYYEAHDVLEDLWLEGADDNYLFFKGLIQVAGAFVHLQKQYLHPQHPKHARRMRPAVRLFRLAIKNIAPYGPTRLHLDVDGLCRLCEVQIASIEASDFTINPWRPNSGPELHLSPI